MARILAASSLLLALLAAPALAAPIELKLASPGPARSALTAIGLEGWASDVNAASEGTLHIRVVPGTTLADFNNMYDRITSGVVNIGFGLQAAVGGKFPKSEVASLPFERREAREASLALWRLYEKGVLADEYRGVKVLGLFTFGNSVLHGVKPIRMPDDAAGLKMGAASKLTSDLLKAVGAVPLSFNPAEIYEALNRGALQGVSLQWTGVKAFKYYEVAKNHLLVPFGSATAFVFMNQADYDGLSAKAKAAIDKFSGEPLSARMGEVMDKDGLDAMHAVEAAPGQVMVEPTAEEEAAWAARIRPVVDAWVKATPDGEAILAAFRREIAAIRAAH
jgi:TRAP-type C4-dicarboxylate transport system substrate-binding protein